MGPQSPLSTTGPPTLRGKYNLLTACGSTITYPEVAAMRAILDAACVVKKEGHDVHPEIMIPLAFSVAELRAMRGVVDRVAREVFEHHGTEVKFKFGTMIELPRAALLADQLAQEAEFFSLPAHPRRAPARARLHPP